MKIGNQQIESGDFAAYSETMRGLATADKQDPFDAEISSALDQLGNLHDILGDKINLNKRSKASTKSSALSIDGAAKMK
jgi:hypothetical protein